jgi:hypothetical protein
MLIDSNSEGPSDALANGAVARLDWNYPLMYLTSSFVLMGSSALFRALSISAENAYFLAIALFIAWRYGVHRAGIFPWDWRSASNHPSLFLKQGLLNGVAFFSFFIAIPITFGQRPTLTQALLTAPAGLIVGLYEAKSKAVPTSPRPQSANS